MKTTLLRRHIRRFLSLVFFALVSSAAFSQNLMLVHQKVGNRISLPLESIDSVRYRTRPLPQRIMIFRNDKSILSLKISNIDSISFSLPAPQVLPEVLSISATALGSSRMLAQGSVENEGPTPVSTRGFCWSQQPLPTVAGNHSKNGLGLGAFSDTIGPLEAGKQYYIRAYASNQAGTSYGEEFTITSNNPSTGSLPSITTAQVQYEDGLFALSGGDVTSEGTFPITARGICWAMGTTPSLNHSYSVNGSGPGSFSSLAGSLLPDAVYRVRAFATSEAGTAYGQEFQFTSDDFPEIRTMPPFAVGTRNAMTGYEIKSMGRHSLLKVGFCWSTQPNPDTSDIRSADSVYQTALYNKPLWKLTPSTTWYFRAYAESPFGIVYGNEMSLHTKDKETVTDIDGNVYETVRIGSQVWMKENLKVSRYQNGDPLPNRVNNDDWYFYSSGAYSYYNHDTSFNAVYGKLYNLFAVIDPRGLCPVGWHVPSDEEWRTMESWLGMKESELFLQTATNINRGSGQNVGGKLMAVSDLWNRYDPWNPFSRPVYTNESGFSGLPAGERGLFGNFGNMGSSASWWSKSTDEISQTSWWYTGLTMNYRGIVRGKNNRNGGLSVRCLKDTDQVPGIGRLICDSAMTMGPLIADSMADGVIIRLPYSGGTGAPYPAASFASSGLGGLTANLDSGTFAVGNGEVMLKISGVPFTNASIQFPVTIGGKSCVVNTFSIANKGCVSDIEGNFYHAVQIGGTTWMQENLRTGRFRNGVVIPFYSDTGYAYYDLDTSLNVKYGKLYRGGTVLSSRGLCPAGWHVSTDEEWKDLELLCGLPFNQLEETNSVRGPAIIGKIKARSPLWIDFDSLTTNQSGFSGLPGGASPGDFGGEVGKEGHWWTSSIKNYFGSNFQIARSISEFGIARDRNYLQGPFVNWFEYKSVRCVKDDTTECETCPVTLTTLSTATPFNVTSATAFSGGNISQNGGTRVMAKGICWSTSPNPTVSLSTKTNNGSGNGSFTSILTGLTANTTYYIRAYATNFAGTAYGNQVVITTAAAPVIETVLIPAGTFTMGTPLSEPERGPDEIPHEVTLSPFRMGKFEISNAHFVAFLNSKGVGANGIFGSGTPYSPQNYYYERQWNDSAQILWNGDFWVVRPGKEDFPVTNVTWYGASAFAAYAGGRLPTEAEWEYACRAGTSTPFNTGTCLSKTQANFYWWNYPYNGCSETGVIQFYGTVAVDTYPPNAFGLYHMHGNINEYCSDWSGDYDSSPQTNPQGPASGTTKKSRGGTYRLQAVYCRSGARGGSSNPDSPSAGFRLVFNP